MAQFIELLSPGRLSVFVRCGSIDRVEAPENMKPTDIASPETPLRVVFRDGGVRMSVYGCSVLDILHGIHRDDCFLDSRTGDAP